MVAVVLFVVCFSGKIDEELNKREIETSGRVVALYIATIILDKAQSLYRIVCFQHGHVTVCLPFDHVIGAKLSHARYWSHRYVSHTVTLAY
jgi:hypothetical protein